jgi:hypothetical protein
VVGYVLEPVHHQQDHTVDIQDPIIIVLRTALVLCLDT